jgi:hypothetical protein
MLFKAMAVPARSPAAWNRTPLVQWYCVAGAQSQLWRLLPAGAGTFELLNVATRLCLTEPDAGLWTTQQIKACWATPFQDFYLDNILAA